MLPSLLTSPVRGRWPSRARYPTGRGLTASPPLLYGIHRPWVHTVDAQVILHLLRHADHERTTGVPAGAVKAVIVMPLQWLQDDLRVRGQDTEHLFWFARATSHHSDALLRKADWAASQDTVLRYTPPGPGHAQLIVASSDGHLDLRPPTMQTFGAVAQQAQRGQASTHRGHTRVGTAHATVYVHSRDLTAAATNHRALRARDRHALVQRRLRIRKERLSGVSVLPQPCLLLWGRRETPVHMHVGCTPLGLFWHHYRQAVQEGARHLPPGDKALVGHLVALRRRRVDGGLLFRAGARGSRGAATRDCPLPPTRGDLRRRFPPAHAPVGDFAWELWHQRLEHFLRAPQSAPARVHRWLTAAEGDCFPPPGRPGRDFLASLRLVNGTLDCPTQEDPRPYRDLPGGFSKHRQGALFPPWVIGRNSMTAREAHIVGAEWAHEWSWWCATTRTPGEQHSTPASHWGGGARTLNRGTR